MRTCRDTFLTSQIAGDDGCWYACEVKMTVLHSGTLIAQAQWVALREVSVVHCLVVLKVYKVIHVMGSL